MESFLKERGSGVLTSMSHDRLPWSHDRLPWSHDCVTQVALTVQTRKSGSPPALTGLWNAMQYMGNHVITEFDSLCLVTCFDEVHWGGCFPMGIYSLIFHGVVLNTYV